MICDEHALELGLVEVDESLGLRIEPGARLLQTEIQDLPGDIFLFRFNVPLLAEEAMSEASLALGAAYQFPKRLEAILKMFRFADTYRIPDLWNCQYTPCLRKWHVLRLPQRQWPAR